MMRAQRQRTSLVFVFGGPMDNIPDLEIVHFARWYNHEHCSQAIRYVTLDNWHGGV